MLKVVSQTEDEITIQTTVKLKGSFLDMEERIQEAVNAMGAKATEEALKKYETSGAPIQIANVRFSAKKKNSQTL